MLTGVFEGLPSPWHLVIIAAVAFLVLGPKRIADRWEGLSHTVSHWVDEDADPAASAPPEPAAAAPPKKLSWSRRIGRRLTRLRPRRRRR